MGIKNTTFVNKGARYICITLKKSGLQVTKHNIIITNSFVLFFDIYTCCQNRNSHKYNIL